MDVYRARLRDYDEFFTESDLNESLSMQEIE